MKTRNQLIDGYQKGTLTKEEKAYVEATPLLMLNINGAEKAPVKRRRKNV